MPPPLDLLPLLLPGAIISFVLAALSAALALVVAVIAGLARLAPWRPVRAFATACVEVLRGTALLVQLFFLFYVLPLIGLQLDPLVAGVLALGLNFGAYGSEVVRAAILNVERGQWEAAIALNMRSSLMMRRIILPQAFVAMIPPFGNLLVELLKATALLSLVGIASLTFSAQLLVSTQGRQTEIYILVLLLYFAMAFPLTRLTRRVEARISRGLYTGRPVP